MLHARIVHPYLHQQVVIIEVDTAPAGIVPVVQQSYEPLPRVLHSGYILVNKFLQRACRKVELVFSMLGIEHVPVCHSYKQVQFEREIIGQSRFRQSAGSGNLHLTCLLVIHLCEYPQSLFQYFIPVGKHISISIDFLLRR